MYTFVRNSVSLFILIFAVLITTAPTSVLATTGLDGRCFTQSECITAHATTRLSRDIDANDEEINDYFITRTAAVSRACGGGEILGPSGQLETAGFCSPNAAAPTTYSFFGEQSFNNIAEFIAYIMLISGGVLATVATIVVLVAGIQYMTSAGNSAAVDSAKQKIVGAISGVALLSFSYLILHLINPALVNLKPPQTWMINGTPLFALQCEDIDQTVALTLRQNQSQPEPITYETAETNPEAVLKSEAECGNSYYVNGANGQSCQGSICDNGGVCLPFSIEGGQLTDDGFSCPAGSLIVAFHAGNFNIGGTGLIGSAVAYISGLWEYPWIDSGLISDRVAVSMVCKDGKYTTVANGQKYASNATAEIDLYVFDKIEKAQLQSKYTTCGGEDNVAGYVIRANLDQTGSTMGETHFLGIGPSGWKDTRDLGVAWFGTSFGLAETGIFRNITAKDPRTQDLMITEEELLEGNNIMDVKMHNITNITELRTEFANPTNSRSVVSVYMNLGYDRFLADEAAEEAAEIAERNEPLRETGGTSACGAGRSC